MQRVLSDHLRRSVSSPRRGDALGLTCIVMSARILSTHCLNVKEMRACAVRAQEIGDALIIAEEEEVVRSENVCARDIRSPLTFACSLPCVRARCHVCAGLLLFCSITPAVQIADKYAHVRELLAIGSIAASMC